MSGANRPLRVSVVIPAFNRLDMLRRAVASVTAQTCRDLEILVVDDGSDDDVAGALSDMTDARLKVVRHSRNRGAAAARNTGIALATGEYVAFLDSDDEWLPNLVERQLAGFASAPPETVMVYVGVRVVPPVKPPRDRFPRGRLAQALMVRNVIGSTSCVMVRRTALEAIGGFDETLPSCQDWDLYMRLARLGPVEAVPETLVVYRIHGNSITGSALASITGHRRLRRKHAAAIAALPPSLRAEHEMAMTELFLWKRAWRDAAGSLLRALRADPGIWPQAVDRLLAHRLRRFVRRRRSWPLPGRRNGY